MLDYLDDLDSDFSVFHRVDDFRTLPGPLFFSRARRMAAYDGAVAFRIREELASAESPGVTGTREPGRQVSNDHAETVSVPFAAFRAAHPDIVSHSVVKEG